MERITSPYLPKKKAMTKKTSSPIIDPVALDQIRMLEGSGKQGLLGQVIILYLYDSKKLMEKILSCAENGDMESLRLCVHTLKSSSVNVGAIGIFETCKEIEKESPAGSRISPESPWLKRLKEECDTASLELRNILDSENGKKRSS